jgi:hypothetical protein
MITLLKRKKRPKKAGYFMLESLWVNDNAFFWRVSVFEKVPTWFGFHHEYKKVKHVDCGDRDYAIKQVSEMALTFDVVEVLIDSRI